MTIAQHLITDEQIMEAVKSGDLQQVSLLFERYHKRIFNFLAQLSRDRELAEDLTQNVFLRVIRYHGSFREGNRFQSWIYQIARNVYMDHYQTAKNKRADFIDVERMKEHLEDRLEAEEQEEKEHRLRQSMAKLSEEQQELLVLTRFQHMKYEEVAAIMETTVANIKVKVHRAIARLREHYFEIETNG